MKTLSNTKQWAIVLGITALCAAMPALAAPGGTEFEDIYTLLSGWAKGSLGKTIAMGMFIVGLAMGIVRQSVMAAAVGVGGALVLSYGPGVIEGMFSAII